LRWPCECPHSHGGGGRWGARATSAVSASLIPVPIRTYRRAHRGIFPTPADFSAAFHHGVAATATADIVFRNRSNNPQGSALAGGLRLQASAHGGQIDRPARMAARRVHATPPRR